MKYTIWTGGFYYGECKDIKKATREIQRLMAEGIKREDITAYDENGHEKLQNVR